VFIPTRRRVYIPDPVLRGKSLIVYNYPLHVSVSLHRYIAHRFYKGKDKAIPLQAWAGPEASRRLRLPDFKTIGT